MDISGKKLLICEEALIDQGGHFQSWIKAIRKMHLEAGAAVYVAGNLKVIPQVRDELQVLPVYSVNSWDHSESSSWPAWRRYFSVFAHNWRVFWETRRVLLHTGPVDMLFFSAVRVHQIIGIRALCAWGLGKHFRGLTFFLLTSQAIYSDDFSFYRFPRKAPLMAQILKSFHRLVDQGKVILAGDSHVTCGEYEALTGLPMTLFPSPSEGLRYGRPRSSHLGSVFTMLGVSTWDKGIDVFQNAILLFFERYPSTNAHFVLQWRVPCVNPNGCVTEVSQRLRADPRVTLLEHRLSNDEYAKYFSESDFIVLPYRKSTYYNRISGVAVEAAVSGKPILVTQNTWLEWALNKFGSGLVFPEGNVDELCFLMKRCCSEREIMLGAACERMIVARDYNSSQRYIECLWGGFSKAQLHRR